MLCVWFTVAGVELNMLNVNHVDNCDLACVDNIFVVIPSIECIYWYEEMSGLFTIYRYIFLSFCSFKHFLPCRGWSVRLSASYRTWHLEEMVER